MYNDYLAHHGTKGMRWYQRLYQNKDGSLTALGRVHYGVGEKKAKRAAKEKTKKSSKAKFVNESRNQFRDYDRINKMTDEELATATKRLQSEANYRKLLEDKAKYIDSLNPANNTKRQQFVKAGVDALGKGIEEGSKILFKDIGKNAMVGLGKAIKEIIKEDSEDKKKQQNNNPNNQQNNNPNNQQNNNPPRTESTTERHESDGSSEHDTRQGPSGSNDHRGDSASNYITRSNYDSQERSRGSTLFSDSDETVNERIIRTGSSGSNYDPGSSMADAMHTPVSEVPRLYDEGEAGHYVWDD